MKAMELLRLIDPVVKPEEAKIHLASWNGTEDPLDVYLRGEFDEWQRQQSRRNFSRPLVVSLISLRGTDRWLFAGVHDSHGCKVGELMPHYYDLRERATTNDLNGRLVVHFHRTSRQSYLNGERWADRILVHEVRAERMAIADFPGYRRIDISHSDLKLIVRQGLESWRAALGSVAGIYVIADSVSGGLYVGSASGTGGLWGRWSDYAATGHGGNIELRHLLRDNPGREQRFRYSVLEIADVYAGEEDVMARESHWKTVLMTREHGLNAN